MASPGTGAQARGYGQMCRDGRWRSKSYGNDSGLCKRGISDFSCQHHYANMLMCVEGSRYITYQATWLLGEHKPCDLIIASAKAWVITSE